MDKLLLEKSLETQKILRHDFANYLQVIGGYLHVNKPEKASEYMVKASAFIRRYSSVSRIKLLRFSLYINWYFSQLSNENNGLVLEIEDDLESWLDYDLELTKLIASILTPILQKIEEQHCSCLLKTKKAPESCLEIILQGSGYDRKSLSNISCMVEQIKVDTVDKENCFKLQIHLVNE